MNHHNSVPHQNHKGAAWVGWSSNKVWVRNLFTLTLMNWVCCDHDLLIISLNIGMCPLYPKNACALIHEGSPGPRTILLSSRALRKMSRKRSLDDEKFKLRFYLIWRSENKKNVKVLWEHKCNHCYPCDRSTGDPQCHFAQMRPPRLSLCAFFLGNDGVLGLILFQVLMLTTPSCFWAKREKAFFVAKVDSEAQFQYFIYTGFL